MRKARTIIRKSLEKGRELELKPLSVVVLDAGGHVQAFEREDGAAPGRFAIAHGKAYGSVMLGMAGTAQMKRAEDQAYFMAAVNGALQAVQALAHERLADITEGLDVPGLLSGDAAPPLDHGGTVIGAVGVTGDTSDNDVLAAMAGIEAAGLIGEQ